MNVLQSFPFVHLLFLSNTFFLLLFHNSFRVSRILYLHIYLHFVRNVISEIYLYYLYVFQQSLRFGVFRYIYHPGVYIYRTQENFRFFFWFGFVVVDNLKFYFNEINLQREEWKLLKIFFVNACTISFVCFFLFFGFMYRM